MQSTTTATHRLKVVTHITTTRSVVAGGPVKGKRGFRAAAPEETRVLVGCELRGETHVVG